MACPCTRTRRRGIGRRAVIAALALSPWAGLAVVALADRDELSEREDRRCLNCHGQPHIGVLGPWERLAMVGTWVEEENGTSETAVPSPSPEDGDRLGEPPIRPALHVTLDELKAGPHADVRCIECHEDAARLPHAVKLNRATCGIECHTEPWTSYRAGSHRAAFERNDELAPTCASCHGGHDLRPVADRDVPEHRLNSLFLCGDCHAEHGANRDGMDSADRVASYLDSAHAVALTQKGEMQAATCADCHDAHGVHRADDPRSTVTRARIPETCGACHEDVAAEFAASVHGQLLVEGEERAPVCTDCHTAHSITHADSPMFALDIINECGVCHDEEVPGSRRATTYATYRKSYHGQVTRLGSTRAARCIDCHGYHDILPLDHPDSMVSQDNLIARPRGRPDHAPR